MFTATLVIIALSVPLTYTDEPGGSHNSTFDIIALTHPKSKTREAPALV